MSGKFDDFDTQINIEELSSDREDARAELEAEELAYALQARSASRTRFAAVVQILEHA